MATTRKDLRGRTLRKGEMQRSSDKRYAYSYTNPLGQRKYIWTMSGVPSASIPVWSITRWAKAAILFCISQSPKRKQAFGRSLCLIP